MGVLGDRVSSLFLCPSDACLGVFDRVPCLSFCPRLNLVVEITTCTFVVRHLAVGVASRHNLISFYIPLSLSRFQCSALSVSLRHGKHVSKPLDTDFVQPCSRTTSIHLLPVFA
jgi:hypothetical protein